MVEPVEAAAEACLTDDLLFLDSPAKQQHPSLLLDIFDPSIETIPGLEGGGGEAEAEEEEELEWLSNKDAFPAVETFLEFPAGRRASPVSMLGTTAPPLRVPVRTRSKRRRRGRLVLPVFPPPAVSERRRCRHCEAEETPQWRAGPEGPKTLCNACGVRYKSGRLVPEYRPASSPTFSALVHSNSHRRILEMRGRRGDAPRGRRSARSVPPFGTASGTAL